MRKPATRPSGGFWWCPHCRNEADVVDAGEPFPLCGRCGYRGLQWRELEEPAATTRRTPTVLHEPEDAAPIIRPRFRVKANLVAMATQGYLFCNRCQAVTERDDEECCRMCGSSDIEEFPPAL